MMQIPLGHILVLSSLLFSIGVLGVLLRRNAIVIFMSIELMLNAVNLSFVGFAQSGTSGIEGILEEEQELKKILIKITIDSFANKLVITLQALDTLFSIILILQ